MPVDQPRHDGAPHDRARQMITKVTQPRFEAPRDPPIIGVAERHQIGVENGDALVACRRQPVADLRDQLDVGSCGEAPQGAVRRPAVDHHDARSCRQLPDDAVDCSVDRVDGIEDRYHHADRRTRRSVARYGHAITVPGGAGPDRRRRLDRGCEFSFPICRKHHEDRGGCRLV